ncbi:MAG: RnfABCDGE type electron transport complex subunit D, partial [bacterium]
MKLKVSLSPHIRGMDSVSKIMLDVIIALTPAALVGIYY